VVANVWFDNWQRRSTLLEQARHLATWDQTMALLWFEDEEMPAPRGDRKERACPRVVVAY
jgi:hypothetical protein